MKITSTLLFCLALVGSKAQGNFESTLSKFNRVIQLPFSTPDELPYVGLIAAEVLEFMKSEEEKKPYLAWAKEYQEITEELNQLVGVDSYVLHGAAQYFPYGQFQIGETTFLMVLETGFESRSMSPFQSLVLLAFDKNHAYKSIQYLMAEERSIEYEHEEYEDVLEVFYTRSISSKLEVANDILVITVTELNSTQLMRENETEEQESTYTNTIKYLPSKGEFEIQFE